MKMKRSAKFGVIILVSAFLLVPVFSSSSFADGNVLSSAGGFGAADSGGGETGVGVAAVVMPPEPLSPSATVGFMVGVVAITAILAAAIAAF
jgi:hypothetical protein